LPEFQCRQILAERRGKSLIKGLFCQEEEEMKHLLGFVIAWMFVYILATAPLSAQEPQEQLAAYNLGAGWLFQKGAYTIALHDGPGPRTAEIIPDLGNLDFVTKKYTIFLRNLNF
jgi:hypothetical protein